jgi:hypothetical protein
MVPIEDAEITFQIPFVDFSFMYYYFKNWFIDKFEVVLRILLMILRLLERCKQGLVEYCAVILAWCPSKKSWFLDQIVCLIVQSIKVL